MGGFIPQEANPFHGFRGSAPISHPTPADRAAVQFNDHGQPVSTASGEALALIGEHSPGQHVRDGISTRWFFDKGNSTVYAFESGKVLAGFIDRMASVIHLRD